jgi:hypothetical protein
VTVRRAPVAEASVLVTVAAVLVALDETITGVFRRVRRHPVGLLVLAAGTGAAIGHLWLDDTP